jgi:Effector-associated domain 11/CHAT domain
MTLKELKEKVRNLISKAKIKEAMDEIATWAHEQNQEQLKRDVSLLKGDYTDLSREKTLGLLGNSDATIRQNQLNNKVLNLLDSIEEEVIPTVKKEEAKPEPSISSDKLKILMLTANPAKTTKLNLDKEHSNIVVKLEKNQEKFSLMLRKAVTSTEFKEFTETLKPDILHFSGHGEGGSYAGIVVQNDDKNAEELISIDGLDALFEYFQDQNVKLKIVLLNACYSEEQALTISKYVPFVIGTNVAIGDVAASAFSTGFYYKLAASENLDYEQAFKSGRTEATLKGAARSNFILFKDGIKAPI